MTDNQWISIVDYLQSKTGFNDRNFITIREQYQQKCGGSFLESPDVSAIKEVARQLKIKIDTDEDLELLSDCVITPNMEDCRTVAKATWNGRIEPLDAVTANGPHIYPSTTTTDGMTKHFPTSIAQLTF